MRMSAGFSVVWTFLGFAGPGVICSRIHSIAVLRCCARPIPRKQPLAAPAVATIMIWALSCMPQSLGEALLAQ